MAGVNRTTTCRERERVCVCVCVRRDVTAQTAMGTHCSNGTAGVHDGIRLRRWTCEQKGEWKMSSILLPALGQAVRVI